MGVAGLTDDSLELRNNVDAGARIFVRRDTRLRSRALEVAVKSSAAPWIKLIASDVIAMGWQVHAS